MFSIAVLGEMGLGLLANPCGELKCSVPSPFFSEGSVWCFCHLSLSRAAPAQCPSPKSAPSALFAGENATFSWNLDERGRRKHRAAGALGVLFSSCRTQSCQVSDCVLLSSLVPGPGFAEHFTVLALWALRCAAVLGQLPGPAKCSEKRNNFVFCTMDRPKEKQGWSFSSKGRVCRNGSESQWFLQQKNFFNFLFCVRLCPFSSGC